MQRRACPQPGGTAQTTGHQRVELGKETASSEKATTLNPTDAFSQQPQNLPTMASANTCPDEQTASTRSTHSLHPLAPQDTFGFLLAGNHYPGNCPSCSTPRAGLHDNERTSATISGAAWPAGHREAVKLERAQGLSHTASESSPLGKCCRTVTLRRQLHQSLVTSSSQGTPRYQTKQTRTWDTTGPVIFQPGDPTPQTST